MEKVEVGRFRDGSAKSPGMVDMRQREARVAVLAANLENVAEDEQLIEARA